MKPCKKCGAENRNKSGNCIPCSRASGAKWRKANPEKKKANSADWQSNNPERARINALAWARNNPEKCRINAANWSKKNPNRCKANARAWRKENPEKCSVKAARRRAMKVRAIPSCGSNWFEGLLVKEVYILAKTRSLVEGKPFHVDHIVPLISDIVQGFHCSSNLQILEGSKNCYKGNRTWPNMP